MGKALMTPAQEKRARGRLRKMQTREIEIIVQLAAGWKLEMYWPAPERKSWSRYSGDTRVGVRNEDVEYLLQKPSLIRSHSWDRPRHVCTYKLTPEGMRVAALAGASPAPERRKANG